jgi:uncharacterized protein (DUF58 family)
VRESAVFQFAVAAVIGRPVAVITAQNGLFQTHARVYGDRASDSTLMRTRARCGAPSTLCWRTRRCHCSRFCIVFTPTHARARWWSTTALTTTGLGFSLRLQGRRPDGS